MDVTIYDVAERAGVAASTVSRAFSRPDRVSFKTAEKIRRAAVELGYHQDLEVRAGTNRKTEILGLVVADIANPFFLELARGAQHAAATHQMLVATVNTNESTVRGRTAVDKLAPFVDGLLLASTRVAAADIQKIARGIPTVFCNRPVQGVPSVLVDNHDGALKAMLHLEAHGCTTVTYLAGPEGAWADGMRWRGVIDAVNAPDRDYGRGLQPTAKQTEQLARIQVRQLRMDQPTITGGRRAFEIWKENPSDAVICYNDLAAIGFIKGAQAHGIQVPDDVKVIGFDNTEMTVVNSPTLTTVAGPLRTVGRVAAANLIALIEGMNVPLSKPRRLPTRLIVRESTGPVIS